MAINLDVKVKKLVPHVEIPSYGKEGDAGIDLVAIDKYHNRDYDFVEYGTGLALEIPAGYVGLLFPRSSVSKTPLYLCNSVGVVDSNYRGEVKLRYRNVSENKEHLEYEVGDRVGQLIIIPYPTVILTESSELTETSRGSGGFGSSGR